MSHRGATSINTLQERFGHVQDCLDPSGLEFDECVRGVRTKLFIFVKRINGTFVQRVCVNRLSINYLCTEDEQLYFKIELKPTVIYIYRNQ